MSSKDKSERKSGKIKEVERQAEKYNEKGKEYAHKIVDSSKEYIQENKPNLVDNAKEGAEKVLSSAEKGLDIVDDKVFKHGNEDKSGAKEESGHLNEAIPVSESKARDQSTIKETAARTDQAKESHARKDKDKEFNYEKYNTLSINKKGPLDDITIEEGFIRQNPGDSKFYYDINDNFRFKDHDSALSKDPMENLNRHLNFQKNEQNKQ